MAPDEQAERVAEFLIDRTRLAFGRLWDEGARREAPGPGDVSAVPPGSAVHHLARRRLRGLPDPAVHAVLGWAAGRRPVFARTDIPAAAELLRLQGTGRRCVSLVDDALALAHGDPRHPDGRRFAIHDLCHLEKFVALEHHAGQVGFFASVAAAIATPAWGQLEEGFDDLWCADRDYVFADMNGSAIFLFAALKMKVKMAVRRWRARRIGAPQPTGGAMTDDERACLRPRLERLFECLDLRGAAAEAAWKVSTRRDDPEAARLLLATFVGRAPAGPAATARRDPATPDTARTSPASPA